MTGKKREVDPSAAWTIHTCGARHHPVAECPPLDRWLVEWARSRRYIPRHRPQKKQTPRVSGLRLRPGAIMLTAPNNLRGEATGNGLLVHADRRTSVAGCANQHSGEGLVTAGRAPIVPTKQRPTAGCPFPQKVKTPIGVGRHGPVDVRGDPDAQTVGPRSRVQNARPADGSVRTGARNRRRRLQDCARPGAREPPTHPALARQ